MNTRKLDLRAQLACAFCPTLVLAACSSGGRNDPGPGPPPPEGYVVTIDKIDAKTLDVHLARTRDESVLGLQFDLMFPMPQFAGISVADTTKEALLEDGYVGVGIDASDGQRVMVAAGQPGNDSVRGVGDLLTFRLRLATNLPDTLTPMLSNHRVFQVADQGQFAIEAQSELSWTVIQAR